MKKKNKNFVQFFRKQRMDALTQICDNLPESFDVENRNDLQHFINESIYDVIRDMAPNFEETVQICWWQSKIENCSKFVFPVMTEEGICFTFNSLNSREIYTDQ